MILYDSTSYLDIPTTAQAVAYYCDGLYATTEAAVRTRFPTQPLVRIAVFGQTNDGNALDVERGDATPDEAPQWVQWRRAAGVLQPWVYCNRSNRAQVEAALAAGGITASQVALWVATLDGTQTVPAGPYPVAAVQYANSLSSGGHYDLSLVNEQFGPGGGTLGGENDMIRIQAAGSVAEYLLTGSMVVGIPDPATANSLGAAGVQLANNLNPEFVAGLIAAAKALESVPGGAGAPAPTTLTLDVPAQTITGKLA